MMDRFAREPDFEALKTEIVAAGEPAPAVGRQPKVEDHLAMLAREFSGRPALLFYHAGLTVLIRRGLMVDYAPAAFMDLWRRERDFLLARLDSRWLVSTCDTLLDIADDPAEIGFAAAATLMVNTVRLYETERRVLGSAEAAWPAERYRQRELFDGLTEFGIGHGDMVFNLKQRIARAARSPTVSAAILGELFQRMRANDTVFSRLRIVHVDPETRW